MQTVRELHNRSLDLSVPQALGIQIERNQPLAPFTSLKVGGAAEYFASVQRVDSLIKLVRWARSVDLPYLILGGGSNVLISDAGIKGLVIQNRCRQVRVDDPPCCDYPQDLRPFLFAESGAAMAGLARTSINAGLAGLEWAVSVPGTVGGAVINNAGAHGGEVKDTLWDTLILDEHDEIQELKPPQLRYDYRSSSLKRGRVVRAGFGPVVLSANFRLGPGNRDEMRSKAEGFLAHRRRTQPVEPSLGSTFKNPPGDFAGRLIDAAGLRGHRIGGIEISQTHANFFTNPGGVGSGSAAEVVALMEFVQATILDRFAVNLEPEIQWVGEWTDDQ